MTQAKRVSAYGLVAAALIGGCTGQQPQSANTTPAALQSPAVAFKPYIGKTCTSVYRGTTNKDTYYVASDGDVYVQHVHNNVGRIGTPSFTGGDALRKVTVTGTADWPYRFVSDSGAWEFPKPSADGLDMRILFNGNDQVLPPYSCEPASTATMAAVAKLPR